MKQMRSAIALMFLSVFVVGLTAADFWETKPFPEWSDKDVDKLLNDSPWSGKASLTHAQAGGQRQPVPDWKVIVTVRSALPVRHAFVRRALGAGVAPPADVQNVLAASPVNYVIAFGGFSRAQQMQLPKAGQAAALEPKGKEPIPASGASVLLLDKAGNPMETPARGGPPRGGRQQAWADGFQILPVAQRGGGLGGGPGGGGLGNFGGANDGSTAMLLVEFPKTNAIAASDGEVEVSTVVGGYNVKKTFKLKDMMFQGALAF